MSRTLVSDILPFTVDTTKSDIAGIEVTESLGSLRPQWSSAEHSGRTLAQ